MLAHNGGPNYSSGIRKMIYFRLRYNFLCKDSSNLQSSQNMLPIPNCSSWDEIVEAQKNDIWFDLPRLKWQVEKLKNMMSAAL